MHTTRHLTLLAILTSCMLPGAGRADHAPSHDRIAYVRPYATAVAQARRDGRILIVRPFPVGGVLDGSRDGRWCPLADYMRAVTLSDETVVTLINRRFVFTYFSLVDWSELSDPDAKHAIVAVAPELGAKVRPTPPTFFFSPEGKVLATLDTLEAPAAFLRLAKSLLAEHPEYDRPSADEATLAAKSKVDPRSRLDLARLRLELADVAEARTILESLLATGHGDVRADALHLLGRVSRVEGDAERAERYFAEIDRLPEKVRRPLALDIRMERAHLAALRGEWARSLEAWSAIEADVSSFARLDELLYAKGLSYYRLGRRRDANHTWVRILEELPEGRYYQRARLAAMGPTYSPPSPDLALPGASPVLRLIASAPDPSRLRGAELGFGTSSDGRVGTDETPERFLRRAYRDHGEIERRRRRSREAQ